MSSRCFGLLVVLSLVVLLAGSAQAQLKSISGEERETRNVSTWPIWDDDDEDGDFDSAVGGAWMGAGTFDVDVGCDGVVEVTLPFTDTQGFGAGGLHVVTNPTNPNSNLGTWEKTGGRQLTSRDVSYAVDATPGGSVTSIAVITLVVNFDDDFQTATSTFEAAVYLPDQDPLDPAEMPFVCTVGRHDVLRKVNATE